MANRSCPKTRETTPISALSEPDPKSCPKRKRNRPSRNPSWRPSTVEMKHFHRMEDLFKQYRARALRLGVPFELSFWDFIRLLKEPCLYCEKPPSNRWHGFTYSGIDRAVNHVGYVKGNAVSCCRQCNSIKSDFLTAPETRAVALALKKFRAGRA
jgi:hypothetical protein